jgi:integrase
MATVVKARHANARKPWTVRYTFEGRTRERSFRTKGEATEFKTRFEHDSREHVYVDPRNGSTPFIEYAEGWISRLDRSPNTKATYRSVLASQIAPALSGRTVAQVAGDREAVQALISGMDAGASRKSAALVVILGSIREAQRAGKIAGSRLEGLTVRKEAQAKADILPATRQQLEALAGGMWPELALSVWLMRGCGLRISEVLAVRLGEFRDGGRLLRVSEQVTRDGGYGPLKDRLVNEYRDVPVPCWLWEKVQEHAAEHGTQDGYLFRSVSYSSFRTRFTRSVRAAGLGAGFTPHHLRHLFVSVLLAAGVPITDVAAWVGHRDIRVTYAIYGHLLPDSWTRGREALEQI